MSRDLMLYFALTAIGNIKAVKDEVSGNKESDPHDKKLSF